jgi:EAL and modified HD-GYP domain-containing signal transduction protein
MDVYIARQPIFDRNMSIYGYELLYRQSENNSFVGIDDDQATAELIYNSFLVIGLHDLTEGTKAFINFSKELIDSDVPLLLPKENIIIEILEREEATESTLEACKRMRSLGYSLALDDFVLDDNNLPLLDMTDIVKVEFPSLALNLQRDLIKRYRTRVRFLAEKIETREEFQQAVQLGYDLFQGYFFSKPCMVNSKEIISINANLFSIIEELNVKDPCFDKIAEIIKRDLGLSYKLLKLSNSVYFGSKYKIKSIPHALSYMGIKELYQWISLMMLKDLQNVENAELIKISLIRGKLMDLLASELNKEDDKTDYFFTGMFSFIDILMNKPMDQVLEGLPLSRNVKEALLGEENELKRLLDFIINCEKANWLENQYPLNIIGANKFMNLYSDALKWAKFND